MNLSMKLREEVHARRAKLFFPTKYTLRQLSHVQWSFTDVFITPYSLELILRRPSLIFYVTFGEVEGRMTGSAQ